MRALTEMKHEELQDAHEAAGVVASDKYRPYLPGRLLPVLVARFRDNVAEAMGIQLSPLPQRHPVRPQKLDGLTSSEFTKLWDAVDALAERFAPCMDNSELPRQLASFREELARERAERENIAEEFAVKAKAS